MLAGYRNYDLVVLARRPLSLRHFRAHAGLMRQLLRLLPDDYRDPDPLPLGGHYGVTRSLVVGLQSIGADFAYEPALERTTARAAIVLCNSRSLLSAIEWKRRGGCEVLFAGPNIVDDPYQENSIIVSSDIDGIVVASRKMQDKFEAAVPSLGGRMKVWPAGVDASYWKPSGRTSRDRILIYNKRMPDLTQKVTNVLDAHGYRCDILTYGDKRKDKYRPRQFRALLDRAFACVFLSFNEPQGIAPIEAWSMGVPTYSFRSEGLGDVDTVPYQTPATGRYWSSFDELLPSLSLAEQGKFNPRGWVLDNMTDAICAGQLLALTRAPRVNRI